MRRHSALAAAMSALLILGTACSEVEDARARLDEAQRKISDQISEKAGLAKKEADCVVDKVKNDDNAMNVLKARENLKNLDKYGDAGRSIADAVKACTQ